MSRSPNFNAKPDAKGMVKVTLHLPEEQYKLLTKLATDEMRSLSKQVAHLVQEAAEREHA